MTTKKRRSKKGAQEQAKPKDTLCWHCDQYECPWRQSLKPVDGWETEESCVRMQNGAYLPSWIVISCPLFKREKKYANDSEWEKQQKGVEENAAD